MAGGYSAVGAAEGRARGPGHLHVTTENERNALAVNYEVSSLRIVG